MKTALRRIALALLASFAGIQLLPAGRTNPPATGDVDAPPEVRAILRRACYDCHSNETRWPWYAHVAPVAWRVVSHVDTGRKHLNFSEWSTLSEERRRSAREECFHRARDGTMPLASYVRLHSDARLSELDLDELRRWAGR